MTDDTYAQVKRHLGGRGRRMLSDVTIDAIVDSWTEPMCELGGRLTNLPRRPDHDSLDEIDQLSYLFAVDALREMPQAIDMLLGAIDEFRYLPTYREVFLTLARMFGMRHYVNQLVASHDHQADRPKPTDRPARRYGFRRGA